MMCRLMIRTKVKNKGSRPSSSDSLARMRELPTNHLPTSGMQNSSFPVVQHSNSAPDFGALLNNNNHNPSLSSISNYVGSSSPRFSTSGITNGSTRYQNERFTMADNKTNPNVDERLLMAVAAMCNDETNSQQASHRPSMITRRYNNASTMAPSNNSLTIQRKTIEAFNRLSRGGAGGSGNPHLDVLRSSPGIPIMNNNHKGGGSFGGHNNVASLLVRQGGGGGGGIVPQAPSPAAVLLDDMDDSDMESIFNEDDYAVDPPELPYICPDDSLASLSEWRRTGSSGVLDVEPPAAAAAAATFGGPTSSCPVAADLVEVFHPC